MLQRPRLELHKCENRGILARDKYFWLLCEEGKHSIKQGLRFLLPRSIGSYCEVGRLEQHLRRPRRHHRRRQPRARRPPRPRGWRCAAQRCRRRARPSPQMAAEAARAARPTRRRRRPRTRASTASWRARTRASCSEHSTWTVPRLSLSLLWVRF